MKYWVFDLDGTLVDSLSAHFGVFRNVFGHFGLNFTEENEREVLSVSAKTLPHYFESKLGLARAPLALSLFEDLTERSLSRVRAFDGIEDLLRLLKVNGAILSIWTARDLRATQKILHHSGLKNYFSICVSGSCTQQSKPHPEGLVRISEYFSSDRDSMIMIGDFDSDMLGAKSFGIKSVRASWQDAVPFKKCEMAHQQFTQVQEFKNWCLGLYVGKVNFTSETIRCARKEEALFLTELAARSKAHWPYDQEYLFEAARVTQVRAEDLENGVFRVAEMSKKVVGFYGLAIVKKEKMLDHLWIEPEFIGKGLGRALFLDAVNETKKLAWSSFTIAADPYAEGFYLKQGAVRIGERESKVRPGFFLPLLKFSIIEE